MNKNIKLNHEYKKNIYIKKGFNVWVLLFGGLVPLFKGDIKNFFIMLIGALLTYGIANIFFAIKYNEWLLDFYIKGGYKIDNLNSVKEKKLSKEEIDEKISNLSFIQKFFISDREIYDNLPRNIKITRFIFFIISMIIIIPILKNFLS